MADKAHRNALKPGYRIGSYEILEILGQGGFGITYLAMDSDLNRRVAMKEFLPVELAVRDDGTSVQPVSADHRDDFDWGLERFITEAQTLARFKHPNIVRVLAVIRENNTAYIIMEYEHGRPFHELLKDGRTLPEDELKNILFPILDGLKAIHNAGFIHRDIKPPNIYIREDNSPVLIDFGSARQSLQGFTRTLTTMVSPGYAPFEQYVGKSDKQGPWTDIYGLGATLYRAATGVAPPDSMARSEALLHGNRDIYVSAAELAGGDYSPAFLAAIDRAMAFKTHDRPQSIDEWLSIFAGSGTATEAPVQPADAVEPATFAELPTEKAAATGAPPKQRKGFLATLFGLVNNIIMGLGLLGILAAVILIFTLGRGGDEQQPDGEITSSDPDGQTPIENAAPSAPSRTTPEPPADEQVADPGTVPARQADAVHTESTPAEQAPQTIEPEAPAKTAVTGEAPAGPQSEALPPTAAAPKPETAAEKPKANIPPAEQARLDWIRKRVRDNPRDPQARADLREMAQTFERKIVQAVKNEDYDLARAYVHAIQEGADRNTPAYRKLERLLTRIKEKEQQAGNR